MASPGTRLSLAVADRLPVPPAAGARRWQCCLVPWRWRWRFATVLVMRSATCPFPVDRYAWRCLTSCARPMPSRRERAIAQTLLTPPVLEPLEAPRAPRGLRVAPGAVRPLNKIQKMVARSSLIYLGTLGATFDNNIPPNKNPPYKVTSLPPSKLIVPLSKLIVTILASVGIYFMREEIVPPSKLIVTTNITPQGGFLIRGGSY